MIKGIKDVVAETLFTRMIYYRLTDIHHMMVDEGLETNCENIDEVIFRFSNSEYEDVAYNLGYEILMRIINDIKEEQKDDYNAGGDE